MIEACNDEHVPNANAGALRDILSRWPASMAMLVLNEVECRLRLMAELRGKLDVVGVDEVRCVTGGLQRGSFLMAERATEGRIDFAMTDETIGHLGEIRLGERGRLLHSAVAGCAGIRAIQMAADIAGCR